MKANDNAQETYICSICKGREHCDDLYKDKRLCCPDELYERINDPDQGVKKMKFIILTKFGSYIVEAEDFDEAASKAYDNHVGYDHVTGIIKMPEDA